MSATILDQIVAAKRIEIDQAKRRTSESEMRALAAAGPDPLDFYSAVIRPGGIRLIAEVKKASPSKGVIRADFEPVRIAESYASAGASAISVLTDAAFFQGGLEHLRAIRGAVSLPLLRKDFILDRFQLWEARAAGADAVLLIAECLDDCSLRSLHNAALDLGMTPLVEFHEDENLPRVLECGARLIGVNNRDLRTFAVDLRRVVRMRQLIPRDCGVVAESGIAGPEDAFLLEEEGIQAMLVGEHLMRQKDIAGAVKELLSMAGG